jgi:hypothetical protein
MLSNEERERLAEMCEDSERDAEQGAREALERIAKAVAAHEADPIDNRDRPSSWQKLSELREAIHEGVPILRAALAHRESPVTSGDAVSAVYTERANVVALAVGLARRLGYPVGALNDANEPGWVVVLIELPTGQVSWHFSAADFLRCFPTGMLAHERPWDGHSTPEKYERCARFSVTEAP